MVSLGVTTLLITTNQIYYVRIVLRASLGKKIIVITFVGTKLNLGCVTFTAL